MPEKNLIYENITLFNFCTGRVYLGTSIDLPSKEIESDFPIEKSKTSQQLHYKIMNEVSSKKNLF